MASELESFIAFLVDKGVTSYLEIGARYGDTFYDVMRSLPVGSKGVCVDLPGEFWGSRGSDNALKEVFTELTELGYDVHLILGDSTADSIVNYVRALGPYDAALLDGDHRYGGVSTDFSNYAHHCKHVALHDIAGEGQRHSKGVNVEVPRFWRELEGDKVEFVAKGSKMGIGVWTI
jgi:hypothetical protein